MMINKFLIAPVVAMICCAQVNAGEGWETNFEAAKTKAKEEGKLLFIEFTGSDWCPPCMAMKKNVLDKPEFLDEAKKDFVLVELDFPRSKEMSAELKKQNGELAATYKIQGYPTIIMTEADGKEITRRIGGRDMEGVKAAMKEALDKKEAKTEAKADTKEMVKEIEEIEATPENPADKREPITPEKED